MEIKKKFTSRRAFGILNAYGDLWTPYAWGSMKEAEDYLREGRKKFGKMSHHKVVPVKIAHRAPLN